MEILLRYILLYIIIIFGSIFISNKLKKKIDSSIIINFLLIMIILYIFGIFNLLNIGVWLISFLELILGSITIAKYIKNKELKLLKENILTTGFIFFTIIYFVFAITTINKYLTNWDQFSYWSYAAKDMYYTNNLIITPSIGIQYPPIPTILEYFFMKVIGIYAQGIEAFAVQLLGFSLLLPLFEKIKDGKIAKISLSIIILCIPAIFSTLIFYESSYSDALLGLLIGYIFYLIFCKKDNKIHIISLILSLIVITLIKPIGFAIALLLIIIKFIYEIIKNILDSKKLISKKMVKILLILFVTVLIIFVSWKVLLIVNTSTVQQESKENITSKISLIAESALKTTLGIGEENNDFAISNRNLITKLYETTEITTPVKISIAGTICILIIICLYMYKKKLNDEEKKNFIGSCISVIIGLILYVIMLQFAYITQFPTKEMLEHDGFERYMATYLLAFLYFIIAIYIIHVYNKKDYKPISYIILMAIIITITPIQSILDCTITSGIYNIDRMLVCNSSEYASNHWREKLNDTDKVLVICQDQNRIIYGLMIRYYIYPIKIDIAKMYTQENIEEFDKIKDNYNYIYVLNVDDFTKEKITKLLNIEIVKEKTLYSLDGKIAINIYDN